MNLANQIKDLTTHWNMAQESGIVLTLAASGRVHLAFEDDKLDQRTCCSSVARLERTARKAEVGQLRLCDQLRRPAQQDGPGR